jgi:putative peptidoglycan lipid II flippase
VTDHHVTAAEGGMLRQTASITAWNLVSRITGFVRVLAVGAALGTTFLGNTYQSANQVSNILFELLAAGLLSSVLVPSFVAHLARGERDDASRLAGAVLGFLLAVLTPLVVAGMLAGPWIMRVLTIAVDQPAVRSHEIDLGAFFLWFFLPQVLLYAVGTVSTALLQADHRFGSPAAAPVANNEVVTATMAVFWIVRDSASPGLTLDVSHKLLLALGTTAGVLAMTAVPLVAARRVGLPLRPRWEPTNPGLEGMGRKGAWAAGYLGLTQLLLAVTLVLANRVEGGVVAAQIAFTFFLLPFALVGNPIMTAVYPRLAADAHATAWEAFAAKLGESLRLLAFLVLPASALLMAVARPALRIVAAGALTSGGPLVASTLAAYAVGLIGYSAFQLLTRASYAEGDTRSPTLVNLGVAVIGSALMVWWSAAASGDDKVVVLGLAHSVVQLGGAAVMLAVVRRRLPSLRTMGSVARSTSASVLAGAAAYGVVRAVGTTGRAGAVVVLAVAAVIGAASYLAVQTALRSPELRMLRSGWRGAGAAT